MAWRAGEAFFQPAIGVPYSKSHRISAIGALIRSGSVINASSAGLACACPSTLYRYMKKMVDEGHFRPREHTGGPERKLTQQGALFLWLWTMAVPEASCDESATALQMFCDVKKVRTPLQAMNGVAGVLGQQTWLAMNNDVSITSLRR